MAIQSSFRKLNVFEDFNRLFAAAATISDATPVQYNDVLLIAVSGDTDVNSTVDEGGGILNFTGAGGAADGVAITTSPFRPDENGTMVTEVRCKNSSATDFRFFHGFQQTVSLTETVNPYTLSSTTLTANAAGEVAGFYYDSNATTDDFRFMAGANSSASTSAALDFAIDGSTTLGTLGVRCSATLTADRWFVSRVEIDPDGTCRAYFGDETMANTLGLSHIATLRKGELSATTMYFPIVHLLAGSTGDPTPEIDYFAARSNRYWEDN